MARRSCLLSATWAAGARLPGAMCSMIWSLVVCRHRASSSSTVRQDWRRRSVWPDAVQRCTVLHKHRNLLAHAPERLLEEVSADYNNMIYASTPREMETHRKSFIRKWRLKCQA